MSAKQKNNSVSKRKFIGNKNILDFVEQNDTMLSCLEEIPTILKAENYKGKTNPFKDELALNLDKVEVKLKRGTIRDKTVDFMVCLEKDWLLLVEAKFNVVNTDNIAKTITGKINYSKTILKGCYKFKHVEETVIILLSDTDFEMKSNRLRKSLISKNINIKPFRVLDFYNEYFF